MYETWEELEQAIQNCQKCKLCQGRNNIVLGEGNKNADLMFIGEGPGADEDMQGLPFVGKAGKLMNQAFQGLGINRKEVYISNIVKCRPPSNRVPEDEEAKACLDYLRSQVLLVKPKIIVLLGSTALKNILGKEYSITMARGKWLEQKEIKYMPTWHPAALLRDENKKIEFWKDLKQVVKEYEKLKGEKQKLSEYCLNCPTKPCSNKGCPLQNDIPTFIKYVKQGEIKKAYETLLQTTMLGSVCGRICPHLKQCEGSCVRGIKEKPVEIGALEAYVFDKAIENGYDKEIPFENTLEGKTVAIVGGGPAGLTCAGFLARKGAKVTIYEKYGELGGILSHGIPEFRLSSEVRKKAINSIINLGIEVKYNHALGEQITLSQLQNEYNAVFLAFGANVPTKMDIEGENLEGVYGGNTLLELSIHPDYKNKVVAVIGGGNVAMDCARTIKRLGAKKVIVIYRRSEAEMPAETKEIEDAKNEEIEFLFQTNIVKILGSKKVENIECIKTELVEKEGETRKVPVNIPNSNYTMPVDYVVMALGSKTEEEILEKEHLPTTKWKNVYVNDKYQVISYSNEESEKHNLTNSNVFAGGDLIGSIKTVAWAAKDGREAAKAIENFLK